MVHRLPNYLRTYRKRAGFTQDEIAYLLGCKSGAKVSRYESFSRLPSIKTSFAYSVIFRVPQKELFAGEYQKVESEVIMRARRMIKKYEAFEDDPKFRQKINFLRVIIFDHSTEPGTDYERWMDRLQEDPCR